MKTKIDKQTLYKNLRRREVDELFKKKNNYILNIEELRSKNPESTPIIELRVKELTQKIEYFDKEARELWKEILVLAANQKT